MEASFLIPEWTHIPNSSYTIIMKSRLILLIHKNVSIALYHLSLQYKLSPSHDLVMRIESFQWSDWSVVELLTGFDLNPSKSTCSGAS